MRRGDSPKPPPGPASETGCDAGGSGHQAGRDPARFVVQHHILPESDHWDLMFEHGGALATWRSPCPLADVRDRPVPIVRIANHRTAYLNYSGPVSGNRGRVEPRERGRYRAAVQTQTQWRIDVDGTQTRATFRLWRTGPADDDWAIVRLDPLRTANPSPSGYT